MKIENTKTEEIVGVPYERPNGSSYQKRIKQEFLKTTSLQELLDHLRYKLPKMNYVVVLKNIRTFVDVLTPLERDIFLEYYQRGKCIWEITNNIYPNRTSEKLLRNCKEVQLVIKSINKKFKNWVVSVSE